MCLLSQFEQVYCPKCGTGKIISNHGGSGALSSKAVKNIILSECTVLPGTEVPQLFLHMNQISTHGPVTVD